MTVVVHCPLFGSHRLNFFLSPPFFSCHISDGQPYQGLLKEAYRGAASRAIFPLTAEFAEQSNNSWVALNAKAKLVADVSAYEGPYYGTV